MGNPAQEARRRPRSPGCPASVSRCRDRRRAGFTPGALRDQVLRSWASSRGWGQNLGTARHSQVTTAAPQLCQRLGLECAGGLRGPAPCVEAVSTKEVCVCVTSPLERGGDSAKQRLCSVRTLLNSLFFPPWRAGASFSLTLSTPVRLPRGREARKHRCLSGVSSPMRSSFARLTTPVLRAFPAALHPKPVLLTEALCYWGCRSPRRFGCTEFPSPSVGSGGAVPCTHVTVTLGNP